MKDLWQQYLHILHAKDILPPFDRWYVIRAETFLRTHQGKRLKEYTSDIVQSYLADLGRSRHLNAWQFGQAVDAVVYLHQQVLLLRARAQPSGGARNRARPFPAFS